MAHSFGKYRLLERLGGGGMADVWRAEVGYSAGVTKAVALKMIREDLLKVEQFQSLFIDEARISSRISHANVAQVFDFGEVDGRPFLAMELVEGADLHTVMTAAEKNALPIPLDVAAFIVGEVARGLAFAHRLTDDAGEPYGVVHRDVSPQNVLVSYAGEVKLTDFGIARARDKVTQTETGTVMGKFRYMSPEQVAGDTLDERSDIFSCGILLYELVTGRQLFDGRTSAQVVDQIRYAELPDLVSSRPEVDPALDTVMQWTLERDLEKRCPDAATLARDLERYVHVAHPHFTRERVVELLESVVPRTPRVGSNDKTLAYAGTELAAPTGFGDPGDESVDEPVETTAPAKRTAARSKPAGSDDAAVVDGVPRESMAGPAPGAARAPDAPERDATLTLARKPSSGRSTALSAGREVPQGDGAITPMIDATAPTRERPTGESELTETRTAGRARGEAAVRPSAAARHPPAKPRRFGIESVLGTLLALLLLGFVVLLFLRDRRQGERKDAKPTTSMEPGTAAVMAPAPDAGVGSPQAARLAQLDVAIAARSGPVLAHRSLHIDLLRLLRRISFRLTSALAHDTGARTLGLRAAGSGGPRTPPHPDPIDELADLFAARILLTDAVPDALRPALRLCDTAAPPAGLASGEPRCPRVAALRVLSQPQSAALQYELIRAHGALRRWRAPLAGQGGRRYLYPRLAVARDAVAQLLQLDPKHGPGRSLLRYLEAVPRGQPGRLGMLELRVKSLSHEAQKKSDAQVLHLTLALRNADPEQPVTVRPATFRLLGAEPEPSTTSVWKPDFREPLAAGKSGVLELTFAAKLPTRGVTLLLAIPRSGAGALRLQISSDVLP
ncbi:MAG: protein kinase [bacterium]